MQKNKTYFALCEPKHGKSESNFLQKLDSVCVCALIKLVNRYAARARVQDVVHLNPHITF